ncbi:MAG: alkaline phosphatase family protein [Planctomycetes bacterium]|nr:alkaline phosphatase family protein [Planctomycetota bacterium]
MTPPATARKLVLIGLDAADLDVMRPLLDRGELPNMARLFAAGASGILHSTCPPVSAPAWATFLTGLQPGGHGLYAFVVEREQRGTMQLANSSDIHGAKVWDWCAMQGARPVVANVPVTWPAPVVNGAIVTGMLTPESQGVCFTHPPELSDEIRRAVPGYRIDIDRTMMDDREGLYAALSEMSRKHKDLFVHLLRTQRWDCFVGIFTNTDRVQHAFWRNARENVDRHFRECDAHIGEILAEIDPANTVVMLMSDHGFQGSRWKLYVNRALEDAGMLATKRAAALDESYDSRRPDFFEGFQGGRGTKGAEKDAGLVGKVLAGIGVGGTLTIDWPKTRAFLWSLDTGGVAVNLKSRYPHGSVEDADYERVRDEVIATLSSTRTGEGAPAFRWVKRREEVYRGPFVHLAPDVVTAPDDAVEFGMDLDAKEAMRPHRRAEGHHSPRGFVSITGPGIRKGVAIEANIADCLPTMLHAMGLAVPPVCDGKVMLDAFDDARPVQVLDPSRVAAIAAAAPSYSEAEEAELRKSLEGLGYL